MADILANLTQVINNSPQVGSMVGGQMAATEIAQRQGQIDESQNYEENLRSTVLALDGTARIDETDSDRQRSETRRQRLERLKRERERRLTAARAARARRAQKQASGGDGVCAENPDQNSVIDVCV